MFFLTGVMLRKSNSQTERSMGCHIWGVCFSKRRPSIFESLFYRVFHYKPSILGGKISLFLETTICLPPKEGTTTGQLRRLFFWYVQGWIVWYPFGILKKPRFLLGSPGSHLRNPGWKPRYQAPFGGLFSGFSLEKLRFWSQNDGF